jgi:hypothetical protein
VSHTILSRINPSSKCSNSQSFAISFKSVTYWSMLHCVLAHLCWICDE